MQKQTHFVSSGTALDSRNSTRCVNLAPDCKLLLLLLLLLLPLLLVVGRGSGRCAHRLGLLLPLMASSRWQQKVRKKTIFAQEVISL
jgi:hypothetical protein